ncbi:MAG: hypothetical protein ACR2HN_06525 [Tepidiformaceae bacterium]
MDTWIWIVIAAVALIVLVALFAGWTYRSKKRTGELRSSFGGEYDRTLSAKGNRPEAEAELQARRKRLEALDIRPLAADDRERFSEEWQKTQAHFVDEPAEAVTEADQLITEVMRVRGYPVANFEQRASDISVDHPEVVSNYRGARAIALANARGEATTDDLRDAMKQYRALFTELCAGEEDMARAGSGESAPAR